jgi:AcrR family transcriptional regulator
MTTSTAGHGPIFGTPAPLPRGPHGLPRETVVASQRARLLAAVAAVVGETGYPAATVAAIARQAGVSPNVFYEHFEDKEACYLAAYDVFARALLERVTGEITPDTSLRDFVADALGAYLGTLEAEPLVARGFLLEMDGAGPRARERRHEAYAAFAALIAHRHAELIEGDPSQQPLPALGYLGMVHGVRELACDALEGRIDRKPTELLSDMLEWIIPTLDRA